MTNANTNSKVITSPGIVGWEWREQGHRSDRSWSSNLMAETGTDRTVDNGKCPSEKQGRNGPLLTRRDQEGFWEELVLELALMNRLDLGM